MAERIGTKVIAPIVTPDTSDSFPTHVANDCLGGCHQAADITERNAIPDARRAEGMMVSVVSNGETYVLSGGITNGDWRSLSATNPLNVVSVDNANTVCDATAEIIITKNFNAAHTVDVTNGEVWRKVTIKDGDGSVSGTNTLTISDVGGVALIDGNADLVLNAPWASVTIIFDGTNWLII